MDALGEEYNQALQTMVKELNDHGADDFFIIWYEPGLSLYQTRTNVIKHTGNLVLS